MMESTRNRIAVSLMVTLVLACGDDGQDQTATEPASLVVVEAPAIGAAAADLSPALVVEVRDAAGAPVPGQTVAVTVLAGGGSADAMAVSDPDGRVSPTWRLGLAPVENTIELTAGQASLRVDVLGRLDEPFEPEAFGDVHGFLEDEGVVGSTEDLAFEGEERIVMAAPGVLFAVDAAGDTTRLALEGDELVGPLGMAFDAAGDLWVADSTGQALRRISDGVVTTVLTDNGREGDDLAELEGPNYVAFDQEGLLYLTDPCLGQVIRYDPVAGQADAWLDFDRPTEGGPNGLAFGADGRLAIATENTNLLCGDTSVGLVDLVAGLYIVTPTTDGFGERETVVSGFALFGDGVAYDAEDNLYAIFDTQVDLELEESAVWVFPAGDAEPQRLLSVDDRILANLAFGAGEFGTTTLYLALLQITPFSPPEARGLMRFELGIEGLPLPTASAR